MFSKIPMKTWFGLVPDDDYKPWPFAIFDEATEFSNGQWRAMVNNFIKPDKSRRAKVKAARKASHRGR